MIHVKSLALFLLNLRRVVLCFQLYVAIAHWTCSLGSGIIFSLLFQHPFSYGSVKAIVCDDIIHWIEHGRHSLKDLDGLLKNLSTYANEGRDESHREGHSYEKKTKQQEQQEDPKSETVIQRL